MSPYKETLYSYQVLFQNYCKIFASIGYILLASNVSYDTSQIICNLEIAMFIFSSGLGLTFCAFKAGIEIYAKIQNYFGCHDPEKTYAISDNPKNIDLSNQTENITHNISQTHEEIKIE